MLTKHVAFKAALPVDMVPLCNCYLETQPSYGISEARDGLNRYS